MYIYPKNTINIYEWTLYTPINDFICYALNPLDIFKSLAVHIPVLQSILRSTTFMTKIPAHDYHSDDDVSALNNSDFDILATVEKADFVEILDDNS